MRTKYVTVAQVEYSCHVLAQEFMEWGEPIPEFGTRFPGVLERCLTSPQQKFAKKNLYRTLPEKASILFYLMVKNHPFQNGNKRIAVMTLLFFLYLNKKWLKADNTALYNFAKWVAESDANLSEAVIKAIDLFIRKNVIDL